MLVRVAWGWASAVRSLGVNARHWKMAVMQHDNAACEDGSGLRGRQVAAVWGTCNQRNYGKKRREAAHKERKEAGKAGKDVVRAGYPR